MSNKKEFDWNRFWATLIISLIALIFTISIFISYGGRGRFGKFENMQTIAVVNGKPVEFYINSPVVHEYNRLYELYKNKTKEELLERAVKNVISGMLVEEFSKQNGFYITEDLVNYIVSENIYNIVGKQDITSADVKIAKNQVKNYLINTYLPQKIYSFISMIPKGNNIDLVYFKSIEDIKVSLNIVEFNEEDFITSRELEESKKDIEDFYLSNYKKFVSEINGKITVEKLFFNDRESAYQFVSNMNLQPQEEQKVVLDSVKNKNIVSGLPDDIKSLSKPFYENRKYVVYRVLEVPNYNSLTESQKKFVALAYILKNYTSLQSKYAKEINEKKELIKNLVSKNQTVEIKKIPGAKVFETGKFGILTALVDYIPDKKGEALEVNRNFYNISLLSKVFNSTPNQINIDQIDKTTFVIYKILSKEILPSKVSEVIDKVNSSYKTLMEEIIYADWQKSLEKSAKIEVKDISQFAKEL
jgi:hypothetical protein